MKIRKIISGIMAVLVVSGAVPVFSENPVRDYAVMASSVDDDNDYTEETYESLTYKKYSDHIEITGCDESETEIIIPAEIDGLPVTSIGDNAFRDCSSVTEITIPDSITNIGSCAFYGCSSLTSITIPDSIVSIRIGAFAECYALKSIIIPDSVTSIGNNAFYECSNLESITIPDSVTSIGDEAFYCCESLESITIPDTVTNIGSSAFYKCSSLTSMTIPGGVTNIGKCMFYDCSGLESITIPDSVISIGDNVFSGCSNLTSIKIPDSVTDIGVGAFYGCSGLRSITIPDGVKGIDDWTFYDCSGLTSIIIPDSVTSIGKLTFYGCESLESITILNPGCEIYDDSDTITNGTIRGYSGSTAEEYAGKYGYKFEALEADNLNLIYKKYSDHIEITGCDKSAEKIVIPAEIDGLPVTSIGENAFAFCSNLTSITIPDSVKNIGKCAFYYCESLESITILNPDCEIDDNSSTICNECDNDNDECHFNGIIRGYFGSMAGAYAGKYGYKFKSLNSLNLYYEKYSDHIEITGCDRSEIDVIIPEEIDGLPVTIIKDDAFYECLNLESITIPDNVTSIGDSAFKNCTSLESITIPDNVTYIGGDTFAETPWLESKRKENPLVIVNDILVDGQLCEGDIIIPDGIRVISKYAFEFCYGPKSITLPDSVTSIGNCAFYFCSNLISITIPESVTSIGEDAFYDTQWLAAKRKENPLVIINSILIDGKKCNGDIIIPDGVTRINDSVFAGRSDLKSVTIPESMISIGDDAFSYCFGLTEITIPDSVTSIGDRAFFSCSGLTEITIPESMTSIGDGAFSRCSGLESITILNPDCEIYYDSDTICNELDDKYKHYFNGTIFGYSGSTAEKYAKKYGYNFEAIKETENPEILFGDANCDGEISIADATLILQYCGNKDKYNLTEQGIINADVDGTDGISAVDALVIQQTDAGIYSPEDLPLKK